MKIFTHALIIAPTDGPLLHEQVERKAGALHVNERQLLALAHYHTVQEPVLAHHASQVCLRAKLCACMQMLLLYVRACVHAPALVRACGV